MSGIDASKEQPLLTEEELGGELIRQHTQLQEFTRQQEGLLGELFTLVYSVGLWDSLSMDAREYAAQSEIIKSRMERGDGPNIDPRLSLKEYVSHLMGLFKMPAHQADFLITIVKVCYTMILIEKNPMVAAELKQSHTISEALQEVTRF